jgi:hypothetical protein
LDLGFRQGHCHGKLFNDEYAIVDYRGCSDVRIERLAELQFFRSDGVADAKSVAGAYGHP